MKTIDEAAAEALARFDPLAALRLLGTREEGDALALRGIALAQLGEDRAADRLLRRASQSDPRVLAARGDLALGARDLARAGRLLDAAEEALADEPVNRAFVRLLRVRRLLLLGRVDDASALLDLREGPPRLRVLAEILRADIAARRMHVLEAEAAVARARRAARAAKLPPLTAHVERFAAELAAPVARIVRDRSFSLARLADIAALARSKGLVVDACRRELRLDRAVATLATRPVLFALAEALGISTPEGASRALLIERAFGARRTTESLRARLRVEVGRLRRAIAPLGLAIDPTPEGFRLNGAREVIVVLPPAEGEASQLLALLRGGEQWSSSALASATGLGQRAVQRALAQLFDERKIEPIGVGRSRRWVARPPEGFATTLLLSGPSTSR